MNDQCNRRNLLKTGALAAVAGAFARPQRALAEAVAEAGKPCPIRLGLASYTFRNFTRAQLIGFMKQLNVTSLNAKDTKDHLPMDPAAEALALADYKAAGIRLHAAGAIYFKDEDDDIRNKFEYAQRAAIPVIVVGDPTPDMLPRIEKFVEQYDIRVAIHNHGPEDKYFPSPFDVLKAVRNMDPRMGCCIDVGHASRAGANLVDAVHAAGPRLYNLHVKDLADLHAKASQVAVGEGVLPFRELFQALIATGYKGYVDLEYEVHADDPMPGVISSYAYMRGMLTGMGYLCHA
ncbi:MAG: sugar phosphate isomerase/epimerase family protein [Acidobacteriota bacterium]